ncbi:MAG: DUF4402 domain-containing protein [Sphingomonas bacterium]|nr:DUF4402 domain-containing protein [Sphingomonas bacterium]
MLTLYPADMIGALRLPLNLSLMMALFGSPAIAAPVAAPTPPGAQAALMRPLTLTKLADMDFGNLGVTTAGTAVIDPLTNMLAVTGGVIRLGGTPRAARFAGATFSSAVVNIKIPNRTVLLTRIGGTQTIAVDTFTLDGQAKRTMAKAGVFEFAVGATLRPAANQVEGVYTGTFDVTIQYP